MPASPSPCDAALSSSASDPALDSLFLPFSGGALAWPEGPVLFLRAREGAAMRQFPLAQLVCEQSYKPFADELARGGLQVVADASESGTRYPVVLVLPPRQREEARALFARALALCAPGGVVVASITNNEGAKSGEADLKQLAGLGGSLTKHHCRVFWTRPDAVFDATLVEQWRRLDTTRTIESDGIRFLTRPGVFAWDRVDAASELLASHLPADLHGRVADFGAGWGYLSMQVLARCPRVASLDLYEADARALALADDIVADAHLPVHCHWQDVSRGVGERFDAIVCNPPFHALGRGDRPDIGRAFIAAAANALKQGGQLWLVANRHLPYEQALGDGFVQVNTIAQSGGFKIVHAVKA